MDKTEISPVETKHPDKKTEITASISQLPNTWENSSSVLCHYTSKIEYLKIILQRKAIAPRYVSEPLDYLDLQDVNTIAFPMTCFCDIPFLKVAGHMSRYGEYGIALDKKKILAKSLVQPVHYIHPQSPLADDFRSAFLAAQTVDSSKDPISKTLCDYVLSTLLYMKPAYGIAVFNGKSDSYAFQDECEWRYIPTHNFPDSLPIILPFSLNTPNGRASHSEALTNHPETWFHFEWDDVMYLIVPNQHAANNLFTIISELGLEDGSKYSLISKIEIADRFHEVFI